MTHGLGVGVDRGRGRGKLKNTQGLSLQLPTQVTTPKNEKSKTEY